MANIKVEDINNDGHYLTKKISIDNIPDLNDLNGHSLLDNIKIAIQKCEEFLAQGYKLTDFWSNPDVGIEFILKKRRYD